MKLNQMFIAAANELHIPADKTENHLPYDGFQLQVVRYSGYGENARLKAESISVQSDVFKQFKGTGVYDVTLGYGSRKPVVYEIKQVSSVNF